MTAPFRTIALFLLAWPTVAAPGVEFNRDVRPILSDRCFACHGPDAGNRKGNLRLDREAEAKADRGNGKPAIRPREPERSELYRRVVSTSKALRMPPAYTGHDALPAREVETLRQWIEQGAPWEAHWSFLAPQRPALPEVRRAEWARNPIDRFVLQRLEREGLAPSPKAARETLLRRVSLDLTGLPPTPSDLEAFLRDPSPRAYEAAVDRLLSSPAHAERMAYRWMEVARYADTNGYQTDGPRDMSRWRDWVIDAFRRNMPFNQFTVEQIAGDLLPNATLSQRIATGFHRNHRTSAEGGIVPEEFRVEYVADRAETTATVWMGLTLGCARCHDHKYDPLPQRDFYRLFAFFNSVPEKGLVYNFGNEEPWVKAPTSEQEKRLAELDAAVAGAQRKVDLLRDAQDRAQGRWERALQREPASPPWALADGLALHMPLDGAGHERGPDGGLLPTVPGRAGKATEFDGTRFVETAPGAVRFNYTDPFTFAAWVKPETPRGAILSVNDDFFEGQGHGLYLLDGKLRLHVIFRWTDIGLRVETKRPLPMREWSHVAVTYDGKRKASGVRVYVNGEAQELSVLFDDLSWPMDFSLPLRVGAGGGLRFRGQIDEVRLYRAALSEEQVATLGVTEELRALAALPVGRRTPAQAATLRLAFLDRFAPSEVQAARDALASAKAERDRYEESLPTVMVMADAPTPRPTFLLKRGAYDQPGEGVEPGVPSVLPPLPEAFPRNRLGLAQWLVDRSNPLTARVTVNRTWQMLFGTGLVKTVEDFGSQGEWPVHRELLDWLAVELMESGWDLRALLRTVVTSATYRQSSRATPELLQRDPENRLLARAPRLRLPAETIRDQALAASGLLVAKVGGPSVKPYQPAGLWQELQGGKGYQPDRGEGLYRRSLYTYWKRTVAPPSMVTFDSPNRETCTVRESRTNTPLQALTLMNDVAYQEAARRLAERVLREAGTTPDERLARAHRLVLSREPKPEELRVLRTLLDRTLRRYAERAEAAHALVGQGESLRDLRLDARELAAYSTVASLLLNLDEAVTRE